MIESSFGDDGEHGGAVSCDMDEATVGYGAEQGHALIYVEGTSSTTVLTSRGLFHQIRRRSIWSV